MSWLGKIMSAGWHNKGKLANGAVGAYFGLDSYQTAKEEGNSTGVAMAKAAEDFALPFMMGNMAYMGLMVAPELPSMAVDGSIAMSKYQRQLARESSGRAFASAQFNDTEQAYTMRQAGMAQAQKSKYNIQSAMLGNEAKFMMK